MNKQIFIAFSILILAIVFVALVLFTYAEFGSLNPIGTAIALVRVCAFDEPYVQVGFLSDAYIGQSEGGLDLLIEVMASQGFTQLPDEQVGYVHYFVDANGVKQDILFQETPMFSKWIWY